MVTEGIMKIFTYIFDWMRTTTITIDTYSFTIMEVAIWMLLASLLVWAVWTIFDD